MHIDPGYLVDEDLAAQRPAWQATGDGQGQGSARLAALTAERRLRQVWGHTYSAAINQSKACCPHTPGGQFAFLTTRYTGAAGRIPLPRDQQQLWAQHKYSVMARDPARAKQIGREVAAGALSFDELAVLLVHILRSPPGAGRLRNALEHMWGYVSTPGEKPGESARLLRLTVERAWARHITYLMQSTALGELAVFIDS